MLVKIDKNIIDWKFKILLFVLLDKFGVFGVFFCKKNKKNLGFLDIYLDGFEFCLDKNYNLK